MPAQFLCQIKGGGVKGDFVVHSNLGSRTPRIMNNSVYEQIFQTQSVSDNVLCLEL